MLFKQEARVGGLSLLMGIPLFRQELGNAPLEGAFFISVPTLTLPKGQGHAASSARMHTCSAPLDRKKSRHANNLEVDQFAAGFQGGLQFRRIVAPVVEHANCVH